jgi:hypothetical protein
VGSQDVARQKKLGAGELEFQPGEIPEQLRAIPELDLSQDLLQAPLTGGWFRLGIWSEPGRSSRVGVEEAIERSTIVAPPGLFDENYDRLSSIGNVLANIGYAGGGLRYEMGGPEYRYTPFHEFTFMGGRTVAEPLVFVREVSAGRRSPYRPRSRRATPEPGKPPRYRWRAAL